MNKQRAQEKLAHVLKWIKSMWTGDFFLQVFMVWAKGAIDQLNKRRLMKKMLSRVLKRKLSEGFQGWLEVVQRLQKRRMDAVVRIDIMLSSSTREKYTHYYKVMLNLTNPSSTVDNTHTPAFLNDLWPAYQQILPGVARCMD